MDELITLFGGLICFGLGLLIFAAVGHGLWVIGAAAIRALSGDETDRNRRRGQACFACGAAEGVVGGKCAYCGFQPNQALAARRRSELHTTARVLAGWREEGILSEDQYTPLEEILRLEQRRLVEPAPPVKAPPLQPVVTAAAPAVEARQTPHRDDPAVTGVEFVDEPLDADVVETLTPEIAFLVGSPPAAESAPAQVHPLDRDYPPDAPRQAGPSLSDRARRQMADVLTAFMEEKNIRWGELVAGLLIVGSAIGCVVSLQETLREADPYVPAFLLMLATSAIYGAGVYTLRRWDLQSVSRAVLIISLLLIPLNFLAAASPGEKRDVTDPIYLLAAAVGIGVFGAISWFASRTLTREAAPRLSLAVMGAAGSQLYLSRLAGPDMGVGGTTLLFAPPAAAFLTAVVGQTWRASRWKTLSARRAEQTFVVAGLATFSLLTATGLLIHRSGNAAQAAEWLSPTMSVIAAAVVALGLAIATRSASSEQAPWRVAGLAIALLGGSAMTANLIFAWPEPGLLIAVGGLSFVTLAALAFAFHQPALHGSAVVCLAISALVGFHLVQQDGYNPQLGRHLLALLWMGRTSYLLSGLGLASLIAGGALMRFRRRGDGVYYAGAGGVLMAASVTLALAVGFANGPDAAWTTPLLALYAIAFLAAAVFRGIPVAAFAGSILLLAATGHGLAMNASLRDALGEVSLLPSRPLLTAILATATACMALALLRSAANWRREPEGAPPRWDDLLGAFEPGGLLASLRTDSAFHSWAVVATLSLMALALSVVAAPLALWVTHPTAAPNVAYLGLIAAVWFASGWLHRKPELMLAFGWAATAAVAYAGVAIGQQQAWWSESLLHPRHVQLQLSLLAVWSMVWTGVRWRAERSERWRRLLNPAEAQADQLALGAAVLGLFAFAAAGCVPGVAAEMNIELAPRFTLGGVTPELAYDLGGWLALVLVMMAVCVAVLKELSVAGAAGLVVASAAAPLLAAAPFTADAAAASACRWWFALYGLAMCLVVCARRPLLLATSRVPRWRGKEAFPALLETVRATSFVLSLAPIVGLTLAAAVRFLAGHDLGGPRAGSLFAAFSPAALYAGPLLALVAILTAYAVRERMGAYLMLASGLFQATVTLACLLALAPLNDAARLRVELLQWNAIGLGAFSLLWLALQRRVLPRGEASRSLPDLLPVQLGFTNAAVAALGVWAAVAVFLNPASLPTEVAHLGRGLSFLALGLLAATIVWRLYGRPMFGGWSEVVGALLVAGALAAASAAPRASAQAWTGYYVLTGSWLAVMALMSVVAFAGRRSVASPFAEKAQDAGDRAGAWKDKFALNSASAAGWAVAIGAAVTVLATGASVNDPNRPWWSAGPMAIAAVCAGVLSVARDRRVYAYAGTGLAALAATFVALGPFIGLWTRDEGLAVLELIEAIILAVVVAGGLSLAYTLRHSRRASREFLSSSLAPPVHSVVAVGATGLMAMLAGGCLWLSAYDRPQTGAGELSIGGLMGVLTALGLGALLIASLWEARGKYALPCLYVWCATAIALALDHGKFTLREAVLAVAISAASYVMITGLLWRSGIGLAQLGARLGVPEPVEGLRRVSTWLPGLNALQAIPWTLLALGMVLSFADRGMRFSAALVPLLLAIGVGSLAQQKRREAMQLGALALATMAAVFFGWADIQPGGATEVWLSRCVRMLIVLAAVAAIYGGIIVRLLAPEHAWRQAVRRITVANGAAALLSLALVLLLEWSLFDAGHGVAGIAGPQIFAVAAVLAGLVAALISLALLPQHDPLAFGEDERMWYVYTAEVVAALLFAHLYMTMPQLFSGVLREYWAYIVVVIAFVGVGVGELFRRWGVRVLAEPLGRTGAFLPLLPALAFWMQASLTSYAGVLFWVGLLYVVLAFQRRSLLFGAAAGLAGNAALWALMQDRDFTFLEHPQFWLIPPAVSVLAATHLMRDQLKESQLAAVRYAAMLAIYLSSTGEMFLTGVGESLWPVMALMTLSVLGVLAGIGLRVRAFLYLGAGFLTLSMISMVWHASKALHHVWPWWAAGFTLGVAILVLFAVFEKRRDAFLQKFERLQTWEW